MLPFSAHSPVSAQPCPISATPCINRGWRESIIRAAAPCAVPPAEAGGWIRAHVCHLTLCPLMHVCSAGALGTPAVAQSLVQEATTILLNKLLTGERVARALELHGESCEVPCDRLATLLATAMARELSWGCCTGAADANSESAACCCPPTPPSMVGP